MLFSPEVRSQKTGKRASSRTSIRAMVSPSSIATIVAASYKSNHEAAGIDARLLQSQAI